MSKIDLSIAPFFSYTLLAFGDIKNRKQDNNTLRCEEGYKMDKKLMNMMNDMEMDKVAGGIMSVNRDKPNALEIVGGKLVKGVKKVFTEIKNTERPVYRRPGILPNTPGANNKTAEIPPGFGNYGTHRP